MRHLANPALNLQIEASNAAAPELAGIVVAHTASIQMHATQNQIFGLVLADFVAEVSCAELRSVIHGT
jgi:hypothetical protein